MFLFLRLSARRLSYLSSSLLYLHLQGSLFSFTLALPFFSTGSFERMEQEGDEATAFTMARILSNIPITRGGPTNLVIYDIHALQVSFFI
ncbi:putative ribose-phosphate diphosphokinase [Helianthus anomalus]